VCWWRRSAPAGWRRPLETLASRTGDRFRVSGCEVRPCVFTSRNLSICQSIARGRDALTHPHAYTSHIYILSASTSVAGRMARVSLAALPPRGPNSVAVPAKNHHCLPRCLDACAAGLKRLKTINAQRRFRGGLVPSDLGVRTTRRARWLSVYGTIETLPATGFLGFLDPQKHSAATQPEQEAVAALPIESSQRTLTHRTVTKESTEPNQQPGQSPVVDH